LIRSMPRIKKAYLEIINAITRQKKKKSLLWKKKRQHYYLVSKYQYQTNFRW
jgi:hypothetical protein